MSNFEERFDKKFGLSEDEAVYYKECGIVTDKLGLTLISEKKSEIKQFFKEELKRITDEMIEVKNTKFKRGGRRWCIECVNRITKEQKKILNKYI